MARYQTLESDHLAGQRRLTRRLDALTRELGVTVSYRTLLTGLEPVGTRGDNFVYHQCGHPIVNRSRLTTLSPTSSSPYPRTLALRSPSVASKSSTCGSSDPTTRPTPYGVGPQLARLHRIVDADDLRAGAKLMARLEGRFDYIPYAITAAHTTCDELTAEIAQARSVLDQPFPHHQAKHDTERRLLELTAQIEARAGAARQQHDDHPDDPGAPVAVATDSSTTTINSAAPRTLPAALHDGPGGRRRCLAQGRTGRRPPRHHHDGTRRPTRERRPHRVPCRRPAPTPPHRPRPRPQEGSCDTAACGEAPSVCGPRNRPRPGR